MGQDKGVHKLIFFNLEPAKECAKRRETINILSFKVIVTWIVSKTGVFFSSLRPIVHSVDRGSGSEYGRIKMKTHIRECHVDDALS